MDKFILAMIGMAIALLIIIGGGFIAVEYSNPILKHSKSSHYQNNHLTA